MSSKKEPNSFVFAVLMCVVCGFLLTFASVGLRERQEKNVVLDQQKNILKAVGLLEKDRKYKLEEIGDLYGASIQELFVNKAGQLVKENAEGLHPIYILSDSQNQQILKYAVPFSAYGLWSYIHGYIG